jgi:hypothetical protein
MTIRRSLPALRGIAPWLGLTLLAFFVAPAHAFFPPVPVHIPKPPIHVPKPPPVVTPPSVTPPGGGGTPTPPSPSPEPASLVLGLLGGAGVSLFVACRRRLKGKGCAGEANC